MDFLKPLILSRGAQLLARYVGVALLFLAGKAGADIGADQIGVASDVLAQIGAGLLMLVADLLIHTVRGGGKPPVPPAALVLLALFPLFLGGCGDKAAAREGHALLDATIRNAKKNHDIVHRATRATYETEAKAHVDTKFNQSLADVQRQAEADKAITPAQIVAEARRLTAVRDQLRAAVDNEVRNAAELQAEADRDFELAAKLNAKLGDLNDAKPNYGELFSEVLGTVKPPKK